MADLKEQWVFVKFGFVLGKTAAETVTVLEEAFKEKAMGKTQVYERFNGFKWDEMYVEDQPYFHHPSVSRTDKNVEKVRQAVLAYHHRTIDEISEIRNVS